MSRPLVSVILPTYDRPRRLEGAVDCITRQHYGNIELVVVDDHSPRPAAEVLDGVSLDDVDLTIVRHEENRGANAARNTGIREASGKYLAFLDDDDEWKPEKLARQVETFETSGPDVGVVYTGTMYVYGDYTREVIFTRRGVVTEDILTGHSFGEFSTLMVRSEVIEEAGPPDPRFPSWQDREWLLRLSLVCSFEPVTEALTVRDRAGDGGSISDNFEEKRDVSYPLFIEKHRDLAAGFGWRFERAFLASLSELLGRSALKNGYYGDARHYLLKSLYYYPVGRSRWAYSLVALGGGLTYRPVSGIIRTLHRVRRKPTTR